MTALQAFAKVNISLRVRVRGGDGFHPIRSRGQSVDWSDQLTVELADEDSLVVVGPPSVPSGEDNLAWRAAVAARGMAGERRRIRLLLTKHIPEAAGLGGGSADAAAALIGVAGLLGIDQQTVRGLAPTMGGDVPFCLTGGSAWIEGRGERLSPAGTMADCVLAVAVAPFELSTGEVYDRWDRLDGPAGDTVAGRSLPPSLRAEDGIGNDLTPAAVSLRPDLGDWIADLARLWERPVVMSGSGPAVFGFFGDLDEAAAAAAAVRGARAARAVAPIDRGWDGTPGGTLPPPPWGVV